MRILQIVLLIFFVTSCNQSKNFNVEEYYNKIVGKKLEIPELIGKKLANDTFLDAGQIHKTINSYKFSILTYMDGDCYSCLKKLNNWKEYMIQTDNNEVNLIIVVSSSDSTQLCNFIKNLDFTGNVSFYFDKEDEFVKINGILYYEHLNTFLIDSSSIVKIIGNPILSEKVDELYKNHIFLKTNSNNKNG